MSNLIYQDKPRYDLWVKVLVFGTLALTLLTAIFLILFDNVEGTLVLVGVTVFDGLLFRAILPSRYQVFDDRLRIALGGPFAMNIPFSAIKEVRQTSGEFVAFFSSSLRFSTSGRYVLEIVRHRGAKVLISPSNGEAFLKQLKQAMQGKTA